MFFVCLRYPQQRISFGPPEHSPKWPGLQPGAKYKFIVSASHPTLGFSEASVTLLPPAAGIISAV